MIAKNLRLSKDFNGSWVVSIELTNKTDVRALQELIDIDLLDIKISKHRKKRTLTQNSALWILCSEIAKKLNTTKDEVYKRAIREVGEFELIPIKNEAVDTFKRSWESNSEGYQCIELRESKLDGYKTLQCYYGSSCYDTKQQSILIDYVVEEAKEQDIFLYTREDIEKMKR